MKAQHREARREVEGQEGGTSWTPSFSPSVLRQPKAQEWTAVSVSPRPLAGGSDKSFKSSFYAGRESLLERGASCQKAPTAPTQTAYTPLADHPLTRSCLTRPRPGCTLFASPLLPKPQGFPHHPRCRPPRISQQENEGLSVAPRSVPRVGAHAGRPPVPGDERGRQPWS